MSFNEYSLNTYHPTRGDFNRRNINLINFGAPVVSRNAMARDKVLTLLNSEAMIEYYFELYDRVSLARKQDVEKIVTKFIDRKIQNAHRHTREMTLTLESLKQLGKLDIKQIQYALLEHLDSKVGTVVSASQKDYPDSKYTFTANGVKIHGEDIKQKAIEIADMAEPQYLARKRAFYEEQLRTSTELVFQRRAEREIEKIEKRLEEIELEREERNEAEAIERAKAKARLEAATDTDEADSE